MVSKRQIERLKRQVQGDVIDTIQEDNELIITVIPARDDDIENYPEGKEEILKDDPKGLTIKAIYRRVLNDK